MDESRLNRLKTFAVVCATTNLLCMAALPVLALPAQPIKPWIVVTDNSQVYAFAGDYCSSIVASPGTVFSVTAHHQITVQKGSVIVIAAGKPVHVVTSLGTYDVAKGSAVRINQGPFGSLEVANLCGAACTFNVDYRGQQAELTIAANKQATLVESQVATAGASDYVAALDAKAGPVNGLMQDQKPVKDQKDYADQLRGVDVSSLPVGMRSSLAKLIHTLSQDGRGKMTDRES